MNTKALRQKILDLAIHGKLVPQHPNEKPASVLLERIRDEKERLIKEGKIKRPKKSKTTSDKPHYENEPFEVPSSWVWTTLGKIGNWQSGATPSRLRKDYYGGNIPWLKTGDLNDGYISDIPEYITETALKETSVKLNPKDSVLIAMYGATIGKVGILSFPATTNQACCACTDYLVKKMYLFYFLLANREKFIAMGGGGAQPNISKEKIVSTLIPLPPKQEQSRIVEGIEHWLSLVDCIEKNKDNLQRTIKEAKSKILTLAIHGKLVPQAPTDEPASELLKRINPKAEIISDNGHYQKLPFKIPKSWVWCGHNDILEISGGSQPAKNHFISVPKDNYIRLYQIRDYGDNPIPVYIPEELASKRTEKGDILLARYGGSLGKVFHAETGAYNVAMAKVIFKYPNVIVRDFAYYYYLSDLYQGRLKEISRTAQAGFNSSDFNEMFFPLPPYEEQKRIVNAINQTFTILDKIMENL